MACCVLGATALGCASDADSKPASGGTGGTADSGASGGAAGAAGASGSGGSSGAGATDAGGCVEKWIEDPDNPHINFQDFGGAVWNDPSVLKEGSGYRMWASSGSGPKDVKIYELASTDGKSWAPAKSPLAPVLVPGPNAFDVHSAETPSVVKLGSEYHMFYTAVPDDTFTNYTIGHAVSSDGETWVKDPAPIIAKPNDPTAWGSLGVAEPGATVKDGVIYLYYALVRCRGGVSLPCTGAPAAERGIGLATSTDGKVFTPSSQNPILTQTSSYPPTQDYEGYSTPSALVSGGKIHLFYDVTQLVAGSFRQVALAHAVSDDGKSFTETPSILERNASGWAAFEIRSPTVVDEGSSFAMWFAGNNGDTPSTPGFKIGIGRATAEKCP